MKLSKTKSLTLAALFAGALACTPSVARAQRVAPPAASAPAGEPPAEAPTAPPTATPEAPTGETQPKPAVPAPIPESHVRPPPPKEPVVRSVTTPVIVSGVIAGVGLVTGVVFAINAASEHSSYEKQPNHKVALAGERSSFIADVSFGMAALFGLTALALYFLPDEPTPSAAPAPSARTNHAPSLASALKGELLRF